MTASKTNNSPPSVANRRICMPIIESIHIDGYPLYPGEEGKGLSHTFQNGVTVVAGINGQGKTTLLNVLYRVLVGSYDQSKSDYKNPGKKQHKLTTLNRFGYFSARIDRSAESATAKLVITFGEETVTIKRTLGPTLEIKELWRGKTQIHSVDEKIWQELVLELTGLASEYDFHFAVRNFLFFLEDKIPLLWNPYGQFEILRILFLPKELAAQCAGLHDEILKRDSIYRNERWHLNLLIDRLRELQNEYGSEDEVRQLIDQIQTTEARFYALRDRIHELEDEAQSQLNQIDETESSLFRAEIELHDSYSELEKFEFQYFSNRLPDATQTAKIVFSDLLADRPCLVCGTVHHNHAQRVRSLLTAGQCPACESTLSTEQPSDSVIQFDSVQLKQAENKVAKLRLDIQLKNIERAELRKQFIDIQNELNASRKEILILEFALNKARGAKDQLPQEVVALRGEIDLMTKAQHEKREILRSKRAEYERALVEAAKIVESAAQMVCDAFKRYADDFLLESASLYFEMHTRTVGESGQRLEFPNFIVKMSSSVNGEQTERGESDQVSESQREFVDLAFRMALLNVVISHHGPAMLVIETPEASLDAVFIERAGKMLRAFSISNAKNKVLATCNLNGENMIRWLLGNEDVVPEELRLEVDKHVINLLANGRPTSGYSKEKKKYDEAYREAIYGTR